MDNSAVTIAIVGILATCVGGLLWIIKFMFNKMTPLLEGLTKSTDANTSATKTADKYLRDRNGRDAESHKESIKAIEAIPLKMQAIADKQAATLIKNLKKLPAQKIEHQHVQEQKVENVK